MPSRAQPFRIGPFTGGLNNRYGESDIQALPDADATVLRNWEVDLDGALVCRPSIVQMSLTGQPSWTERIKVIGQASFESGFDYLIMSNGNGTYARDQFGTWTTIKLGLQADTAIQYQDNVWIPAIPETAVAGGFWNPTSGYTEDTNLPKGSAAVFFKSRMFVVPGPEGITSGALLNASRLQFSDPVVAVPFTWPSENFIDVSPGDGQKLIDLLVYNDNLMLFKEKSTHVLAFDSQPTDAILRVVNDRIGATAENCVVVHENTIYVLDTDSVYEIVNYNFEKINIKVPFDRLQDVPGRVLNYSLSIVGDRIVVIFFDKKYVFSIRTRTWAEWDSANQSLGNVGRFLLMPGTDEYFAGSALASDEGVYRMYSKYVEDIYEGTVLTDVSIECQIKTKFYDFSAPMDFKKLMWWGVDVQNRETDGVGGEVTGLVEDRNGSDTTTYPNQVGTRKIIRFPHGMRFTELSFTVTAASSGGSAVGPCKLFAITAMVSGNKQQFTKAVET